jgi:hypothetical protein
MRRFEDGWVNLNPEAIVACFTPNVVWTLPDSRVLKGREACQAFLKERFASPGGPQFADSIMNVLGQTVVQTYKVSVPLPGGQTGTYDGTDVYVNVAPFDRQLGRLSLDVETLVGKTIRMEQVQKNGTTFTNVSLARAGGPASAPAAASSAPRTAAAPAAPKLTVSEASALYREALMGVYQTLGDACAELGVPVTADALQAAAATVFIAANRR